MALQQQLQLLQQQQQQQQALDFWCKKINKK
jgi:hypothetical protein